MFLYSKYPYQAKYQLLINKLKSTGLKHFNDSKAFIEYSNNIIDAYTDNIDKNIAEYNPNEKCKIITTFDDMIAGILTNKNPYPIVTELCFRGKKQNIFLVFITQSCTEKY